MKAMETAIV